MRSASSALAFLWRPHEHDRLPEEVEARFVQHNGGFETALLGYIGRFSWKMSSWKDVASKLEAAQSDICQAVSKALELEEDGFAITEIQLHILDGAIGKQEETGWTWKYPFFMDASKPRFVTLVNRKGQYLEHTEHFDPRKTYAVSVGDSIQKSAIPALPSLQEFGIKSRFDELQQKYTEEGAYGLLVQHPYQVIEWLTSARRTEQWGWKCEMVIMSIQVKSANIILQLSVSPSALDGNSTIAVVALSGEEVCSMVCKLDDTTVASLLEESARKAKITLELLKLITPGGDIIDYKSGHLLLSSCIRSVDQ